MTKQEIEQTYEMLNQYHAQHLKSLGVKLPKLKNKGNYTMDALVLIYLAKDYPHTRVVSKAELTRFIQIFHPEHNDTQQARHLSAQRGWYILSGTRGDYASANIPEGHYQLKSLTESYPGFTAERRDCLISSDDFEALKAQYDHRCATCGSREGEAHRYWKNTKTKLQRGHMNPHKALKAGNIIPQCEKCNQADRNWWIYDAKGRVISVANERAIDKASEEVKRQIYKRLKKHFNQ